MRYWLIIFLVTDICLAALPAKTPSTPQNDQSYFNNAVEQKFVDANRYLYKNLNNVDNNETSDTIKQMILSTYNIGAFRANYFLPVSYGMGRNYTDGDIHEPKKTEIEFQLSLRYDFATNLLGLHGVYSAAYTQHSFWQAYAKSAYFRESNYNPELFVTFPMFWHKHNNTIKAFRIELAHQSNGRGGEYERSWNYVSGSVFLQYHNLFTQVKTWVRLKDTREYNPDLLDYLGYGDINFTLPYNKNLLELMVRSNFHSHGAIRLSYSYPLAYTNGLFLYIKGFSGYGESLIDYNHYVNSVAIGFSLSR
jgi:phospholipase A1/A2